MVVVVAFVTLLLVDCRGGDAPAPNVTARPKPIATVTLEDTPAPEASEQTTPITTVTIEHSPTPADTPAPTSEPPQDIVDLLDLKKIEVRAKGAGIDSVSLDARRLSDHNIIVRIPVGTFFVSRRGNVQNMISKSEETLTLKTNQWTPISLPVACANRTCDIPGSGDNFYIRRSPQQKNLIQLMPELKRANASVEVEQAAVWIVTNNADYSDLGSLVGPFSATRTILQDEAARAMKILDDAGIAIERMAIWEDRKLILLGLEDERLISWFQAKADQPEAKRHLHTGVRLLRQSRRERGNAVWEEALAEFDEAIRVDPQDAEAYRYRGLAYYRKVPSGEIAEDPAKRAFSYFGPVTEYYAIEELNRVIADVNIAIELNPDDAESYRFRGIAYRKMGDLQQAIVDFNRALQLNPDYAAAYANRASAYGELGRFQNSVEDYGEAIRLYPYARYYAGRAKAYTLLADDKSAQQDIDRSLELGGPRLHETLEELREQRSK